VTPARRTFALFLLALPCAASGCRFSRNGQWHDAAAAARHMRDKYDYLLKFNLVTTTESFIERAATQSSMSGQAYLVDCGGGSTVPSAQWFSAELRRKRAGPPK
jgi:hypothetical protein